MVCRGENRMTLSSSSWRADRKPKKISRKKLPVSLRKRKIGKKRDDHERKRENDERKLGFTVDDFQVIVGVSYTRSRCARTHTQ